MVISPSFQLSLYFTTSLISLQPYFQLFLFSKYSRASHPLSASFLKSVLILLTLKVSQKLTLLCSLLFIIFLNHDKRKHYIVTQYMHTHALIPMDSILYTHIIETSFLKRCLYGLSFSYFVFCKISSFGAPKLTSYHDHTDFLYTSHEVVQLL